MKYLFVFLFLLIPIFCRGQATAGSLEVTAEDPAALNSSIKQLEDTRSDQDRTLLLLKICRIYWYKNTEKDKNIALNYALRARELSASLQLTEANNEATFLICKALIEKNSEAEAFSYINQVTGEERVRLLLTIGEHYVFRLGASNKELDKGYPFISRAINLSDSVKSLKWKCESLMLLGKYYFAKGNTPEGNKALLRIINIFKANGNRQMEAHYWSELGLYMPENDQTISDKVHSHQMAFTLYWQSGSKKDAAYTLRDIAVLNKNHNNLDSAEAQITKVIAILDALKIQPSFSTYRIGADIFRTKGDFNKALKYILQALNTPETRVDKKMNGYETLADIYGELGMAQKSLHYYQMVLNYAIDTEKPGMFLLCHNVIREELNLGSNKNALTFLKAFVGKHPPFLLIQKELISGAFGDIYAALKENDLAAKYYLQMIAFDKSVQGELKREIGDHNTITGSEAYYTISGSEAYYKFGKFYVDLRRFREASFYLLMSLSSKLNSPSVKRIRDIEFLLFRVDSASGNYLSALNHHIKYQRLNDSIFGAVKSKQISELQIKYETKQNQQSISLLRIEGKNQRIELQKVNLQKNLTLAGITLLLIMAVLIYNSYRHKKDSNRELESKQKEIHQKNFHLNELVTEKDKLLEEKDWLLKEVHHRVKNNLQIVMSLLNSQSIFLKDKSAINAIRESQNRVRAISLIHQKLYGSSNVSVVDMPIYISELIDHLKSSFKTNFTQIRFEQFVDPIELDIAQALPIGLILNEGITNAIKYAFPDNQGIISVTLQNTEKDLLTLKITDNGVGLSKNIKDGNTQSLGMKMLKALSRQLDGQIMMEDIDGLQITVIFRHERPLITIEEVLNA